MKKKTPLAESMAPRQRGDSVPSMKTAFPQTAESDPLRHLTIQVPESLRMRIKMEAARRGVSVRDLATAALVAELDNSTSSN